MHTQISISHCFLSTYPIVPQTMPDRCEAHLATSIRASGTSSPSFGIIPGNLEEPEEPETEPKMQVVTEIVLAKKCKQHEQLKKN